MEELVGSIDGDGNGTHEAGGDDASCEPVGQPYFAVRLPPVILAQTPAGT